jgi:hypothetical protein
MTDLQLQTQPQTPINATGWAQDKPDDRDRSNYIEVLTELPASVDLREWCSPIEHQGKLNSVSVMNYSR